MVCFYSHIYFQEIESGYYPIYGFVHKTFEDEDEKTGRQHTFNVYRSLEELLIRVLKDNYGIETDDLMYFPRSVDAGESPRIFSIWNFELKNMGWKILPFEDTVGLGLYDKITKFSPEKLSNMKPGQFKFRYKVITESILHRMMKLMHYTSCGCVIHRNNNGPKPVINFRQSFEEAWQCFWSINIHYNKLPHQLPHNMICAELNRAILSARSGYKEYSQMANTNLRPPNTYNRLCAMLSGSLSSEFPDKYEIDVDAKLQKIVSQCE